MERLKVYTKEDCPQCDMTTKILGRKAIDFVTIPLTQELAEGFRDEGLMSAPVVDTGVKKWAGFRPDKINEYEAEYNGGV